MPKYVADGTKQVAGPLPENSSDRITSPTRFTVTKTPNYITVTTAVVAADGIGFAFNSASFATKAATEGGPTMSGSTGYEGFNTLAAGNYNFHPIAVSGSAAGVAKIKFVYKSGLSTGGF